MLGLVVTSPLRTSFQWFRRRPPLAAEIIEIPKPLTLDDECHIRGVRTYDLAAVRAFQLKYQREQIAIGLHNGGAGSQAVWLNYSVREYSNSPASFGNERPPIPMGIQETIDKVGAIEGSELHIEAFDKDPFLFIVRKRYQEPIEVCCIGFWDTPFDPDK